MNDLRWPLVTLLGIVVAGIVVIIATIDDPVLQRRMVDYFGTIVGFIVGSGVGGAAGATVGYLRGKAA
jgi:hypothetical protein